MTTTEQIERDADLAAMYEVEEAEVCAEWEAEDEAEEIEALHPEWRCPVRE